MKHLHHVAFSILAFNMERSFIDDGIDRYPQITEFGIETRERSRCR